MAASVSPKFSWLTPEVESFSADLVQVGGCVISLRGWFSQLWLVFVLLRVDALGDGCRIWEFRMANPNFEVISKYQVIVRLKAIFEN